MWAGIREQLSWVVLAHEVAIKVLAGLQSSESLTSRRRAYRAFVGRTQFCAGWAAPEVCLSVLVTRWLAL